MVVIAITTVALALAVVLERALIAPVADIGKGLFWGVGFRA